ncbi:hypothetical protein ACEPPN_007379 [Leptodophora sp. 'Broadleaf-Isolate-01']
MYDPRNKLIVAIDFGTTYSGVAYAFANVPKPDVASIRDWPGLEGFLQLKVPTVICYGDSSTNNTTWGAQKHKGDVVQGLKLLLDPDQPWPLYLPESTAKTDLKRLGKPAVEVAADFLSAIYKHAMKKIESSVPADFLMICQKEFVLIVPAVWSDKAKDTTLKAAKQAGIHPVVLVKEPEAAAMYTLHMMKDMALSVGDAFVICDAGGGTVDLTSYEITQLTPRLELRELVPGKGGMAGSLGLNKRFEQAVKELVGEDQYFTLCKTIAFQKAVQQFDRSVKTAFRGGMDEEYCVNFPMENLKDDPANDLTSNCWNMKGSDVKKIFDPLITDIQRLVNEQVNLVTVKRLSGAHPNVEQIKACPFNCELVQKLTNGRQSSSSVDLVLANISRVVLCKTTQQFKSSSHMRHGLPLPGVDTVELMTWYIYQGDDLKCEQVIKFPFYRSFPEATFSAHSLTFTDNLIQSESKIAPIHPSPSATKVNCVLTADLTSVDRAQFKKTVGADGLPYINVHYHLVITVKTAMMKFSIEVNGKEMGTVNASYD